MYLYIICYWAFSPSYLSAPMTHLWRDCRTANCCTRKHDRWQRAPSTGFIGLLIFCHFSSETEFPSPTKVSLKSVLVSSQECRSEDSLVSWFGSSSKIIWYLPPPHRLLENNVKPHPARDFPHIGHEHFIAFFLGCVARACSQTMRLDTAL